MEKQLLLLVSRDVTRSPAVAGASEAPAAAAEAAKAADNVPFQRGQQVDIARQANIASSKLSKHFLPVT